MKQKSAHVTTTFQLSTTLHEQLKLMCLLTHRSMGEFIRIALIDKMKELKVANPNGKP